MKQKTVSTDAVRSFWEANPVCAKDIPFEIGSPAYFARFDRLRGAIEDAAFGREYYQFENYRGRRVLDVGSGNGYILSHYASHGADVTGVDITQAGVDLCRKRFDLQKLSGTFQVADAERLPFPDNTFDLVCSMGVLHHTPRTDAAVAELRRVLKPGGRVNLMLYHRNSVLYRFKFPILRVLTGKSLQQLVNEVDGAGNPKGDVYSRNDMRSLLRDFEAVNVFTRIIHGWMTLPVVGRFLPDALFRPLESRWGWFLYANGIKPDLR